VLQLQAVLVVMLVPVALAVLVVLTRSVELAAREQRAALVV
jgi:hypothetical protein